MPSPKSSARLKDWLLSNNNNNDDDDDSNNDSKILLMDGGVSTHLRDLYQRDFEYPELWSSSLLLTTEGKECILQGHKDWLLAGSNILTTVTYQCHHNSSITSTTVAVSSDQKMTQMLRDGIQLAQRAVEEVEEEEDNQQHNSNTRNNKHYVVASIGCYGAALADGSEYTGRYPDIHSEQDLIDFHTIKTQRLLEAKPDGIALETVPCVAECKAFVRLLQQQRVLWKEQNDELLFPACWISLACRNGDEINDGSKLESALEAIYELDNEQVPVVQAIGVNCCDSNHVASLVRKIVTFMAHHHKKKHSATPTKNSYETCHTRGIVIYPNSGEEWDAETKTWKEGTGLRQDDLQDVFATRLMEAVDIIYTTWNELMRPTSDESTTGKSQQQQPPPAPAIILGGCCRTRPATIRSLRKEVDRWHSQRKQKPEAAPKAIAVPQQSSSSLQPELTPEQQRMMNLLLGRDADFDRQLGDIGSGLQDLMETQQHQSEAVGNQSSVLKNLNSRTRK